MPKSVRTFGWLLVLAAVGCRTRREPGGSALSVDQWISHHAIAVRGDSSRLDQAIDSIVTASADSLQILAFGEPLHLGEAFLAARNRIFRRLVEAHGFSAIAIESGFPESRLVERYFAGDSGSYEALADSGFGWGFGHLAANRDLVEWMRRYNADPNHPGKLRFYGFDLSSTGPDVVAGPGRALRGALAYLTSVDSARGRLWKARLDSLEAPLSGWGDRAKGTGEQPAAGLLRLAAEDLISELRSRRPEFTVKTNEDRFHTGLELALSARATLDFQAAFRHSLAAAAGIRDLAMADCINYIVGRERRRGYWRGRVLVFAHNLHLQQGPVATVSAGEPLSYWPLGSQLAQMFGRKYVVIGSALGRSDSTNGVRPPEMGTLEARLLTAAGPELFIPTFGGRRVSVAELGRLPERSKSETNPSYFPLGPQSVTDFDWIYVRDSTSLARQIGNHP